MGFLSGRRRGSLYIHTRTVHYIFGAVLCFVQRAIIAQPLPRDKWFVNGFLLLLSKVL